VRTYSLHVYLCSFDSILYFFTDHYYEEEGKTIEADGGLVERGVFDAVNIASFVLGLMLAGTYLVYFLASYSGNRGWMEREGFERLFLTSHIRRTAAIKQAGTRKVNVILENAAKLHQKIERTEDQKYTSMPSSLRGESGDHAFENFVLHGEKREPAGSLGWTWRIILSGRLFDTEGIWLPTRLLIFQGGQILFGAAAARIFISTVEITAQEADEAVNDLDEDLPQWV
jgi:hypothetical protein